MHLSVSTPGPLARRWLALTFAGALAITSAAWPSQRVHAGACAAPSANLVLMTPATARVPPGAGLLIAGQMPGRSLGRARSPRDELEFDGTLTRGDESIALRVESIAPGLARLVPERAPDAGTWQLRAGELALPVQFSARAGQPVLSPPALESVWSQVPDGSAIGGIGSAGPRGRSGPAPPRVMASLAAARPAGALVLVLRPAGATGRAFAAVATPTTSRTLPVYAPSGGRCAPITYGSAVPAGASVVATFVDAFGRESAPSDPVVVERR